MAPIATGRSNMANACARAKARKAGLIDSTRMRQLLQQETDAIAASIGEFGYRSEIDIYAARMSGADLIEAALNHNMDDDLSTVLGFCQGGLNEMVSVYVERFSYHNAKVILRAVHNDVDVSRISQEILPEEDEHNLRWLRIAREADTILDAAIAMASTPWGRAIATLDGEASLQEMEDTLDRHYYRQALSALGGREGHPTLVRYIRMEIDHVNIVNQFRSISQGLSGEVRANIMIPGGKIGTALLRQAASAETDEALLEVLRRAPSFDDTGFEDALAQRKAWDSLDPIVTLLQTQRRKLLRKFAHLHPVSAFPVIHYIESKVLEVQNLRLLVRGKAAGLPDEVIEAHMDI